MTAPRTSAILLIAAAAALSACATSSTPEKPLAQLSSECDARGGILLPTGRSTGRDALDTYCRINSGPSERLQPRAGS